MRSEPFLNNYGFQDADDFVQAAQHWNLDIKQIDRGQFRADLTQFGLENILVSHAKMNLANHQQGEPPSGLRTFAVLADWPTNYSPSSLLWRRLEIPTNAVMASPRQHWMRSAAWTLTSSHFHFRRALGGYKPVGRTSRFG